MVDLISVGAVFIDDIVYPNGRTEMGVLGGGAVHAAAGMAVWGERPGLAAAVGGGLPAEARAVLERHFALDGLYALPYPQIRAWQVFEHDGTRRELMRVAVTTPFQDGPPPDSLPEPWRAARGLYMVLDGLNYSRWRSAYPAQQLLWEPNQPYMTAGNGADFREKAAGAQIVSPNLLEARAVLGDQTPPALLAALLALGVRVAALRMGEHGSLVASADAPTPVHIPAVPVEKIIDVTGAGNAYCGAFLAGWLRTGSAVTAGRWGAVAGSLALESTGMIDLSRRDLAAERGRRLHWLESRTG